jgi:hypothetical protein
MASCCAMPARQHTVGADPLHICCRSNTRTCQASVSEQGFTHAASPTHRKGQLWCQGVHQSGNISLITHSCTRIHHSQPPLSCMQHSSTTEASEPSVVSCLCALSRKPQIGTHLAGHTSQTAWQQLGRHWRLPPPSRPPAWAKSCPASQELPSPACNVACHTV